MNKEKILFLGKADDAYVEQAVDFLKANFERVDVHRGTRGKKFPVLDPQKRWDWMISYLCPWVIPQGLLERAEQAAINFHSGPPEYPGIGCTNFAIYQEEKEFGVTCHHMAAKVDSGKIIACRRFALLEEDSVYTLTQRCYEQIYMMFCEVMAGILEGKGLPVSDEQWTRPPFTRRELNALCEVRPDMPADEIKRRIRATTYPGMPGAYVFLGGEKFLAESSLT